MSNENLFLESTRNKWRFSSRVGAIGVEDLWDLPLTTVRNNNACLNDVAKALAKSIANEGEEDFVGVSATNSWVKELQKKLDLVKQIIAVKQAENSARLAAAEKAALKEEYAALLHEKRHEARKGLSEDEILAKLKELEAS